MENHTAIKTWPSGERPREKLQRCGAGALSDAELLALFIRTGVRGKSAVEIGRELLRRHGSLRQVLTAPGHTLAATAGLGPAKTALLQAAMELGKRYLAQKIEREGPLTCASQVAAYLTHQLRDQPREVFAAIYLDSRHCVLQYEVLFLGTLNGAMVHPREVVRSALLHNAGAIILAHNHPSGVAEPSQADAVLTMKIKEALSLVEVRLLDHVVIGDGEYVSMSDRGLF